MRRTNSLGLCFAVASVLAAQQTPPREACEQNRTAVAFLEVAVGALPQRTPAALQEYAGKVDTAAATAADGTPTGRQRAFDLQSCWARVARDQLFDLPVSLVAHERALALASGDGERARVLASRAESRLWLGDPADAGGDLDAALAGAERAANTLLAARVRLLQAMAKEVPDRDAKLLACTESLATQLGDDAEALAMLQSLRGRAAKRLHDEGTAAELLEKARAGFLAAGLAAHAALAGIDLAAVLVYADREVEAAQTAEQSIRELERAGYPCRSGTPYVVRGTIRKAIGRYLDAVADFQRAWAISCEANDPRGECNALGMELAMLGILGHTAELERCLKAIQAIGDGSHDEALRRLARKTALWAVDTDAYIAESAADIREFEQNGEYRNAWYRRISIARRLAAKNGTDGDVATLRDAVVFFESHGSITDQLYARLHLALALEKSDRIAGFAEYTRCIDLVERKLRANLALGRRAMQFCRETNHWILNNMLGLVLILPRDSQRAETAFRAIQLFHGLGMAAMLEEDAPEVPLPAELAHLVADLRQQLRDVHAVRLALTSRRPTPGNDAGTQHQSEIAALDQSAVGLERRILDTEDEGLLRSRGQLSLPMPRSATLAEVQARLGESDAFAEFLVPGPNHTVVVVTRRSCVYRYVPGDIAPFLAVLGQPRATRLSAELAAALRGCAKMLLDPVLQALPEGFALRTLLIAPDGLSCRVPFDALLVRDVDPAAPMRDWPFLVRDCDVAYVHCGTTLRDLAADHRRSARSYGRDFVAMAHPSYGAVGTPASEKLAPLADRQRFGALTPLPGTAEEVLGIARLLADAGEETAALDLACAALARGDSPPTELCGRRFRLLLQDRASEAALKQTSDVASARIVHLACHGTADPVVPELSHLVLAQSPAALREGTDDGYVLPYELRALRLQAQLVTLSACETNAGPIAMFEGTAGLSRAIFAAGANAVLATLWRVQDRAARDLVVDFHRRWLAGGASRIEALALAKRAAIAAGSDVTDWAGFVLWDVPERPR